VRIADILSINYSKSVSFASSTCRSLLSSITSCSFVGHNDYDLIPLDVDVNSLIEDVVIVVEPNVDPM
jgi:hypothetical protein